MKATPLSGRSARLALAVLVAVLALGAGLLVHLLLGLLALRIAAAPGHNGTRAASALAQVFATDHPRLRVRLVPVPTLSAAADALGRDDADLAVVRSDEAGRHGQTLVILRREAAMFVAPGHHDPVDGVAKLRGRSVGLLSDHALDGRLLDRVLTHYGIDPGSVRRAVVGLDALPGALRERRFDALFVVAPVDGAVWLPLYAALREAGAPRTFEVGEAAAIARDDPGLETLDVAKGTLQGSLPAPGDDVTTLSVSYRLVARGAMPDWLAGAITQEVLTRKPQLAALDRDLSGIEAPDTDDKSAALPLHSGAVAYLTGNLDSLSDQVQNALYWMGLLASGVASLGAAAVAVYQRVRPRRPPTRVMRLLEIWLAARGTGARELGAGELGALEAEADELVHATVQAEAHGRAEESEMRLVALLAAQVRQTVGRRRRSERPRPETIDLRSSADTR